MEPLSIHFQLIHKDLGVLISNNLEWSPHQDFVLTKAYKTLGLIRRTFSQSISSSVSQTVHLTSKISNHVLLTSLASSPYEGHY